MSILNVHSVESKNNPANFNEHFYLDITFETLVPIKKGNPTLMHFL